MALQLNWHRSRASCACGARSELPRLFKYSFVSWRSDSKNNNSFWIRYAQNFNISEGKQQTRKKKNCKLNYKLKTLILELVDFIVQDKSYMFLSF